MYVHKNIKKKHFSFFKITKPKFKSIAKNNILTVGIHIGGTKT